MIPRKIFTLLLLLSLFLSIHLWAAPIAEKPIVVVICSYNNQKYYERNLDSVFSQKYKNYRVIYVNDFSTDETGKLVEKYIKNHKEEKRVTLVDNKKRLGAMCNFFNAIHSCQDNEIIVVLDGDDWFAHRGVLERINREYVDKKVWLTYGQYECYPGGGRGLCAPIPAEVFSQKKIRSYQWVSSHVRTFYAWLFKRIKEDDLKMFGEFYKVTCDQAMMLPMLEMAGASRVSFIPDILYIYNWETPINDAKKYLRETKMAEKDIRSRKPYELLV